LQPKPVGPPNDSQLVGTTLGSFMIVMVQCLLSNSFLLKGSSLLCVLYNFSVVQFLWCHVIINLFTTSRRLWNMKLLWSKLKCTLTMTASLPNAVVDQYERLLCWPVSIPMDARFDPTIIHLSWLDWCSALYIFLNASKQFMVTLSPFICVL